MNVLFRIFGRNTATAVVEQIDKTDDARNALHVADQHAQALTDAQLRATPVVTTAANLDITLSALRDALRGAGSKTLTDLETTLTAIQAALAAQEAAGLTNRGTAVGVVAGATATVANIASSAAGYKLCGFQATGTGDGYFALQVAGAIVAIGRIASVGRDKMVRLPNPISVSTGSAVNLSVTNEATATADFEGIIFGA